MAETKEQPSVVVYLTGYGPFGTCKVNPSSGIAKLVGEDLKHHPAVAAVHAEHDLSVSLKVAGEYFDRLESDLEKTVAEHGGKVKVLLCHLGVWSDTNGLLRAEVQGYNELFASLPDVDGVVLNHEPIFPDEGPVDSYMESWFGRTGSPQLADLESLVAQLNAAHEKTAAAAADSSEEAAHKPHEVATDASKEGAMEMPVFQSPSWTVSRDAGRYLCNFALYRALRLQRKHPDVVYSIFIHVVDPTRGKTEEGDDRVVAYNPSVMAQSEDVKRFVHGLISMMTA